MISGQIYYPPSIFHPFHLGYVNLMERYEIYMSHVSKFYFILSNFYYKLNLRLKKKN